MNAEAAGPLILLVDDERVILVTLSHGLRRAGYRVMEATGGEEALGLVQQEQPDLAVLDVRMPNMTGVELAQRLRDEYGVPFMFLSAYGDTDLVKLAAEHGALGYLVKPVDIPQIVPGIEAALARARDIRKLKHTEAQLNQALAGSREVSMAIGLLMERYRTDRVQALEALRRHARTQRRKIKEVAIELLVSAEVLNVFHGTMEKKQKTP